MKSDVLGVGSHYNFTPPSRAMEKIDSLPKGKSFMKKAWKLAKDWGPTLFEIAEIASGLLLASQIKDKNRTAIEDVHEDTIVWMDLGNVYYSATNQSATPQLSRVPDDCLKLSQAIDEYNKLGLFILGESRRLRAIYQKKREEEDF